MFKIYINVRVQLLHFSSAFPIYSSRFLLRSWMFVLLVICAIFGNVLFLLFHRTGTLRDHSYCFLLLMKLMIIARHKVPLVYFRLTSFFHTIFGVSHSKYPMHTILPIQFVFLLFLIRTPLTTGMIRSYVQTNLFTDEKVTA